MQGKEAETILIKTLDKKDIQVTAKFLNCCKNDNNSTKKKGSNVEINFESESLLKVIEFLKLKEFDDTSNIPNPVPHGKLEEYMSEQEIKFLNGLEEDMIIDLMKISKNLGIGCLYSSLLAFIAGFFKDITIQEIYEEYADDQKDMSDLEEELRVEYLQEIKKNDKKH